MLINRPLIRSAAAIAERWFGRLALINSPLVDGQSTAQTYTQTLFGGGCDGDAG